MLGPRVLWLAAAAAAVSATTTDGGAGLEKEPGLELEVEPEQGHEEVQYRWSVGASIPEMYVLDLKPGTAASKAAEVEAALRAAGVKELERLDFTGPAGYTAFYVRLTEAQLAVARSLGEVDEVEDDREVLLEAVPQCPLERTSGTSWGQRRVTGGRSWRYGSDFGRGVDAYILDTGIRCSHQEFRGRCEWGANFAGGQRGDVQGHGTHVAGTVAGTSYGIAPGARVVAVKVLGDRGSGSTSGIIRGMQWVQQQVQQRRRPGVVNMSLGGGRSTSQNRAVAALVGSGVTVVVAAGNENQDACNVSPASAPEAVTVASSTSSDQLSGFSNWGRCVDIIAPGSSIVAASHRSDSGTRSLSGTSMAAPHVAGAAAVFLAMQPSASPAQVEQWLEQNAQRNAVRSSMRGTPNLLLQIPCGGGNGGTPVPPTPPQRTPAPGNGGCRQQIGAWQQCASAPQCCVSGTVCTRMSGGAYCRPTTPTTPATPAPPRPTPRPPVSQCRWWVGEWQRCSHPNVCCGRGLQCTGSGWNRYCRRWR